MVAGHDHEGLQPERFQLADGKLPHQVIEGARTFHRGHEGQAVRLDKGPAHAFKDQIRPAVRLSVPHEHQPLAWSPSAAALQHGGGHLAGVAPGLQQGPAQIDGIEAAGMRLDVQQDGTLQRAEFFPGHDVQGLDADDLHALAGKGRQPFADAAHGRSPFGQLLADDLGSVGPLHGSLGEGRPEIGIKSFQSGHGFGHAGAEGHDEQALTRPCLRLSGKGKADEPEGKQQDKKTGEMLDVRHGSSSMTR